MRNLKDTCNFGCDIFSINLIHSEVEYKKLTFLRLLRGYKSKYKRYTGSPLRYAGGKSWAVGYIVEHIPSTISKLVTPFVGGASVEIAVAKELGIPVIAYDIFDILVNYWQIQITKPQEMYELLKLLEPNHKTYTRIKQELKELWIGKIKLEPIILAAYYYFNHNLS